MTAVYVLPTPCAAAARVVESLRVPSRFERDRGLLVVDHPEAAEVALACGALSHAAARELFDARRHLLPPRRVVVARCGVDCPRALRTYAVAPPASEWLPVDAWIECCAPGRDVLARALAASEASDSTDSP